IGSIKTGGIYRLSEWNGAGDKEIPVVQQPSKSKAGQRDICTKKTGTQGRRHRATDIRLYNRPCIIRCRYFGNY
ncbi:MAG: hypothetical protein JWQ63_2826, partial [Mucilaginibacter sp.]|nr:hypothetical protein [Mucilaginibacter sp.]